MTFKHIIFAAALAAAGISARAQEAPLPGAGKTCELDLGTKRVNWTRAKWQVLPLDGVRDLRGAAGLRIVVTTDQPRGDAGVYVAVREADGSWYEHPWAVDLTQQENTGVALFEDFSGPDYHEPDGKVSQDEDFVLDRSQINAIAFGCVNPLGIGTVKFTIKEIALVPAAKQEGTAAPAQITVTGNLLDINGTTHLPVGLFGGFSVPQGAHETYRLGLDRAIFAGGGFGQASTKPATPILLNCYGDRGIPPSMVRSAKWKEDLAAMAKKAAEQAKATGRPYFVEWWNEPYLNWSNKNRAMYDPLFFDETKATEGGPVHLKTDGSLCPHLKWTRNPDAPKYLWMTRFSADGRDNWRRGLDAAGNWVSSHAPPFHGQGRHPYAPATHPPKDVKDGEKYKATVKGKEVELTAYTPWWVYDETQFDYWSGRGAVRFLAESALVAGDTVKATYPGTTFIGGWCSRPSEDHWASFQMAYQPFIDATHTVLDGVTDHDYGGDAIKMPSSAELVTAYSMTKFGKWMTSWNTECASGSDPSVYGSDTSAANARKFRWSGRKLIHTADTVPDKIRSIAWFGQGEAFAFDHQAEGLLFTMLLNLRGRLVHLRNDDPLIYGVATLDGTDPLAPRPPDFGPGPDLVVALFNDHDVARPVVATIRAPAGTTFSKMLTMAPQYTSEGQVIIEPKAQPVSGDSYVYRGELPAKSLIALTFPLSGKLPEQSAVTIRQFFSPAVLTDVTAAQPSTQMIAIKPDVLKGAKRARLRIVVERLAEGEGVALVNGKEYRLPKAVTPENAPWIRDVPVAVADLKEQNEVKFRVTSPAHAGYRLATASVLLETE
jgi:hypothetical protein